MGAGGDFVLRWGLVLGDVYIFGFCVGGWFAWVRGVERCLNCGSRWRFCFEMGVGFGCVFDLFRSAGDRVLLFNNEVI